jgi:hypothetical protein
MKYLGLLSTCLRQHLTIKMAYLYSLNHRKRAHYEKLRIDNLTDDELIGMTRFPRNAVTFAVTD